MTETVESSPAPQRTDAVWIYGQPGQPTSRHPFTGKLLPFPIHRFRTSVLLILFTPGLVPLLVTLNWLRMDRIWHAVAAWMIGYGGAIISAQAFVLAIQDTRHLLAIAVGLGWTMASLLILTQQRAYAAWRISTPAEPSFWRIGCFVYPLLLVCVTYLVVALTFSSVQRMLLSDTTRFEGATISFDHPKTWAVDSSPLACEKWQDALCLAAIRGEGARLDIIRVLSSKFMLDSTAEIADGLWEELTADIRVWVRLQSHSELEIGGYEAWLYRGTVISTGGDIRFGDQIMIASIRTRPYELRVAIGTSTPESAGAVEALIRSIEVETPEDADDSA